MVVTIHATIESYPILKAKAKTYMCQPKFIEEIKATLQEGTLNNLLNEPSRYEEIKQIQNVICQQQKRKL